MRLLEPFARYKAAKYLLTKNDLRQETSRTADLGWDTHLTQNGQYDTHWPRPINTPNCNSIRPVVYAQGSGDLTSRHVCELSSNHEHSTWLLWLTNRHDDEKHAAQLKLRSEKWTGLQTVGSESSRSIESIDFQTSRVDRQNRLKSSRSIESVDFQSSWVDSFDSIDFKV